MRFVFFLPVLAIALMAPAQAHGQLPPGYWSYYDSNGNNHRQKAHHELHGSQPPARAAGTQSAVSGPSGDPMDYEGRGMTGRGLSAYQSNGYSGPRQNLYYGYWDGGFQGGSLYGYSMYPHFDRPGFTYWQY
jgi:hypothetical protein